MPTRIHLDTDLGGDTDDLCALALLLGSEDAEVVGITTCADAEGRRKGFIEHALKLAGRTGIPVATGARGFLGGAEHFPGVQDARYWPDVMDVPPSNPGEALDLLEASARSGATIVAIGPWTNLAVLETMRPGVFEHSPVIVMGGYLGIPEAGYPQWPSSYDYNVQADRVAARIVLGRLNPIIVSLNVTLASALRARDLPALRQGGPLAKLLALQAELHAADHRMAKLAAANPKLPADIQNFQYDSIACAAALDWECLTFGSLRRELVEEDGELMLSETPDAPERRFVTALGSEAFAARWLETVRKL
jgi:inosine-uridine nucleoside N-ribohydrolase